MATGFSSSLEKGHDVLYDFNCTTCASKNLNAEALFYCKDCRKLFCEYCEHYHDKFTEGHTVLGKKEVAKWGDVKPVTSSIMCNEHPGKELEMYCEDHDRICCHICININHRVCNKVQHVSQLSKGIQNKPEFKEVLSEAAKTKARLKHVYDKHEQTINMLQESREEIVTTFKDIRKKLNQILDKVEADSIKEMDTRLAILVEQCLSDKDTCFDFIDNIQKLLDDIQTMGRTCDELAFQGYKKCSEETLNAHSLLTVVQNVDYQLKFSFDARIEHFLSSLETLGSFQVTSARCEEIFENSENTFPLKRYEHAYTVAKMERINICTSGDKTKCYISGICQLSDGQTAIVDHNNTKVKLLSSTTYRVLDELVVPPAPHAICYTTGSELVVTVVEYKAKTYYRKEIQFINAAKGKLSHSRTIKLDHGCFGIAYRDNHLYIGSWNAIHLYNLTGKKLHDLYDEYGKRSTVCRFSLSDDRSRIYVTDHDKYLLITLDSLGHKLSKLSDPQLQMPTGLCVEDNGSVFVCGWDSNTVVQVDREGKKKMTTLVTGADGVRGPQSLCYDRKARTLLVGQYNNDLLLLHLK